MIEILFLIVLIFVFYGIGSKVLKLFKLTELDLLSDFVFSEGIGLGILALLMFLLGLAGLYYTVTAYFLVAFLAFLSIPEIPYLINKIIENIQSRKNLKIDTFSYVLIIFIAFHVLINLLNALAPPTGFWDALTTYLAIPEIWVKNHGLIDFPSHPFSYWPQNMAMFYVLGMLLKSDILAILIQYWISILTILGIYSLSKEHLNLFKSGLLAVAIFYAGVSFVHPLSFSAGTNFGEAFFLLTTIYAFWNWLKTRNLSWLIVSAFIAGIAGGIRLTGLILISWLALFLVYDLIREKISFPAVKAFIIFSFISLLVGASWYIRSLILTGNPLYPFLFNLFGGKYWNVYINAYYSSAFHMVGLGKNLLAFLLLPWNITLNPSKFHGGLLNYGPIYLAFLPLLLLIKKIPALLKYLIFCCIFFASIWFLFMGQSERYIFSIFPILSIVVAYVINYSLIFSSERWFKIALIAPIMFSIVFNTGFVIYANYHNFKLPVVLGIQSKQDYLKDKFPLFSMYEYIAHNLPKDSLILLAGDVRGYGCPRHYVWGYPIHQAFIDYKSIKDAKDLYNIVKKIGITHIMVEEGFENSIPSSWEREFSMRSNLIKQYAKYVNKVDGSILFRLL